MPADSPRRDRPYMPGYGVDTEDEGMLTWDWVEGQIEKSRNYWIITTRPDGRPHAAPVWGVWVDGVLYFGSGRAARKTKNLAASPEVVVHLESGDEAVIVEGTVEETGDDAPYERIADAYEAKYPPFRPDPADEPESVYYAVRPRTVLAWLESEFIHTPTRWKFE